MKYLLLVFLFLTSPAYSDQNKQADCDEYATQLTKVILKEFKLEDISSKYQLRLHNVIYLFCLEQK